MFKSLAPKLLIIFILTILAIFTNLPKKFQDIKRPGPEFPLVLGLDLKGGSHLVFEADLAKVEESKKETAISSLRNVIERRVNLFGVSEPNVLVSSFEGKTRIVVELPGISNTREAVGVIGETAQLVFAEVDEVTEQFIPTELNGANLKSATVAFDQNTGKPLVSLEFTKEGGDLFSTITGRNVGKPLAIVLDGEVISAPIVQEKISGGTAQISGDFSEEDVKKLVVQLNAGALPVPIKLVEERTIGATLGAESVKKSIEAGLIGLTIVAVFMILMYGKLGLIADLGLIVFGLITMAIYRLIPVVLTLPGIAGFLLSIGMAVDSNILIFERFREERKIRVNILDALEISFGRAWDSIRDANIATLVTAFILANPFDWSFLHTSGPVRGFAMTLAIGVAVSLFTGIFVSRNLLRLFVRGDKK